jgi:hypothetical protein
VPERIEQIVKAVLERNAMRGIQLTQSGPHNRAEEMADGRPPAATVRRFMLDYWTTFEIGTPDPDRRYFSEHIYEMEPSISRRLELLESGCSCFSHEPLCCEIMIHKHALLALAGMLLAVGIGSAQAEVAVDNTHPRRLRPSRSSPCRSPARRPELVCIDGFKPGTVQLVAWQTAYADKVNDLDGSVEIKDYPNDDHFSLPERCVPDARKWLNDLFSSSLPGASLR